MNSSAEQIGYAVGVLLGIVFVLGIIAFAIIAIVKACTKKTTGWIVAGSIGGAVMLLIVGCFAVILIPNVTRAIQESQDDSGGSVTGPSQTITGQNLSYSIKIPSSWTIQRGKRDFDVLANYKTLYVGVIAEEADLGSPEVVSRIARKNIQKVGEDIQFTDPAPVVVDGRNWLRFTVNCNVEKIPFFYQYYVYAGKGGTFQIVTWTFQNLAEKKTPQMNEAAQTFVFPK